MQYVRIKKWIFVAINVNQKEIKIMKMRTNLSLLILLCLGITSCTSTPVTTENIASKMWQMTNYVDDNGFSIGEDADIILVFSDSLLVSGSTGCNSFVGKYSLNESKIQMSDLGSTKMFCGEDKAEIEKNYLKAISLELKAELSSNGNELVLENAEEGIKITYKLFGSEE